MIVWVLVAAVVVFVATVALLRFSLLTRQAKELQRTIESVKSELTPAAMDLVEELGEIRSRVEELRSRESK